MVSINTLQLTTENRMWKAAPKGYYFLKAPPLPQGAQSPILHLAYALMGRWSLVYSPSSRRAVARAPV